MDIVNEIPAVVDADKWVEVWKEAGDKRLRLKEYDNAFVCYCKALGYCPNNLYCLVKRFYLLMLSRNYKNALTAGRRVVELDPTNVKCLIGIAKCCVNLGDVVSAEDAVEQASNIEPDNPAFKKLRNDIEMIICLTKQVIDALKTGAHKKALELIDRGLAIDPASTGLKLLKAESLLCIHKPAEGLTLSSDILKSDKNNIYAVFVTGHCLFYLSDLKTSQQLMLWILSGNEDKDHSYKRAKRLNKKIVKIQLYIDEGNKCIEQKKPVVAKGWFKKALTVDPYNKMLNSKLLCTLADIYAHQKCLGRAIDCCSDALKLDPENRRALKTRALLHKKQCELDAALADFETLYTIDQSVENKNLLNDAQVMWDWWKNRINCYKVLGVTGKFTKLGAKKMFEKLVQELCLPNHKKLFKTKMNENSSSLLEVRLAYSLIMGLKKPVSVEVLYSAGEVKIILYSTDPIYKVNALQSG